MMNASMQHYRWLGLESDVVWMSRPTSVETPDRAWTRLLNRGIPTLPKGCLVFYAGPVNLCVGVNL